ncbi:hypothetical protein B0J12DRAFT_669729 [Macrophomina phaseolina]|uniref:non-specific serine/threonine protein kinase n=1 Tax=Macrophomina phaseolina TaxID=35725 RepID=A0ABQ8G7V0_9PEZI|nr:hypothetical protein B0J12DRAFT_669729 [Macrophomina phaseolina]
MARRTGHPVQRVAGHSNGVPPPSTIAAQIVNNHSRAHDAQQPTNNALFGQLLQEFLSDTSAEESSAETNLQLVSVVVEAGFNALLKENPFGQDVLLSQAKDGVSVVRITIERNPELLFYSKTESSGSVDQPVLAAKLLPTLFSLLSRPSLASLHGDLRDLLCSFLRSLSAGASTRRYANVLFETYYASVNAIVAALETHSTAKSLLPSFRVTLPPPNSVLRLLPEGRPTIAIPEHCQMEISSAFQAINLALALLFPMWKILDSSSTMSLMGALGSAMPMLAADCLSRLWARCEPLKVFKVTRRDQLDTLFLSFLSVLKLFVPEAAGVPTEVTLGPRIPTAFYETLSELSEHICRLPSSPEVQLELSHILLSLAWFDRSRKENGFMAYEGSSLHDELLFPILEAIAQDKSVVAELQPDLRSAIALCTKRRSYESDAHAESAPHVRPEWGRKTTSFEDSQLLERFSELLLENQHEEFPDSERPRKRQRLDVPNLKPGHKSLFSHLMTTVSMHLASSGEPNLEDVLAGVKDNFPALSENDQCKALTALMRLPCAAVGTLQADVLSDGEIISMNCTICDGGHDDETQSNHLFWNRQGTDDSWKIAVEVMEKIIDSLEVHRPKRPRVLAVASIRSLLIHINDGDSLSLQKSALPLWCLKSLKSSLRELRIAAGLALPAFMRNEVPEKTRRTNRHRCLKFMMEIAARGDLGEQETLILALGQVARVCDDDELIVILRQLISFLGHPHQLIYGVAYNELASLAESSNQKPSELFRPFWRELGFEVFKDLCVLPQKAQLLSELHDTTVNHLIERTQKEILPYIVLDKKRDVLKRIAAARGTTVQDVCLQPKENLAAILARLLIHPADDIESSATAILTDSVPEFAKEDLSSLVKIQPILIACEILVAAAMEESAAKKQIHQAFYTFAALAERRTGASGRQITKETKAVAQFFENHILGIMAHFSNFIDSSKDPQPLSERNRYLGAIEELVILAKTNVSPALPQIRACLQSAFDVPQLCNRAFSVWVSLLDAVHKDEIEPLIDQTFSVVVRYWDSFTTDSQERAYMVVSEMVQKHNTLLQERIGLLPSLSTIPVFSKIEAEISRFRGKAEVNQLEAFARRCRNENAAVVAQALQELKSHLEKNQEQIHDTTTSQHPSSVLAELCRSILDASVRFTEGHPEIAVLAAECLGVIGCLDPSRIETIRPRREIVVLSNFDRADEAVEFVAFMLETVLVKAYHSATNAINQAYIAYVMQEMLRFCGFSNEATAYRPRSSQGSPTYSRWMEIPETVRSTLTPFLNSKYEIKRKVTMKATQEYPIFKPTITHAVWLKEFVFDLLLRAKGDNPQRLFPVLSRIIKDHDPSIATFLLPFAVVNIILGGTEKEVEEISQELLIVLETEVKDSGPKSESLKQCSENVFEVLDYMSKWLQEKRRQLHEGRVLAARSGREPSELDEVTVVAQLSSVERVLHSIPAEVISRRAVECGSYSRALFHWEQYMRQKREQAELSEETLDEESLYQHLQYIYTQIDEPDGIEGISAHMQILDPTQQVLEHRKAGRWSAAQSWYEMSLAEKPDDSEIQYQLLNCLRESGQYDSLLAQVESFQRSMGSCTPNIFSLAAEATWITSKWDTWEHLMASAAQQGRNDIKDFNVIVAEALLFLRENDAESFKTRIACHDPMLKLHVLYEIEAISGTSGTQLSREELMKNLDRRLDLLGAYTAEKQYVLGLRRAAMQLSSIGFSNLDLASSWLTTSRLARKANQTNTAFDAVLHAARLGEGEARIEHSRLLWKEGHHRKAIQNLDGAIKANLFTVGEQPPATVGDSISTTITEQQNQVANKLSARAHLLKAKWLDQSGQSSSSTIISCYHTAIRYYNKWEKSHYYLGKHYNKLLESDKAQPKVSFSTKCGEHSRLIIDNFLRAIMFGTKHLHETFPKILTLWLDLGMEASKDVLPKDWERNRERYEREENIAVVRAHKLEQIHSQITKYVIGRLPAYVFYTALPQMITRISHPNPKTYDVLSKIIIKVAVAHPQRSLWSLFAVVRSKSHDRSTRGSHLLLKLKEAGKKAKSDSSGPDLKTLINQGERLSTALLHACDAHLPEKQSRVSLSRDLGFPHKLAPCGLVVPIETTMVASLPRTQEIPPSRYKAAFSGTAITIASFSDDVLVLSSLQRPRKLTVRGSDGRLYGLLCKPKDDLRKDQRLMEFNAMVNRALLGDVESSKRRLDIKTYAVTPLNEECGAIEWVEGLKPMRDILLKLYRDKNVRIDYTTVRARLDEACRSRDNVKIFTDEILKTFRPVLHEWFIETFPEPEAWFAARLKYTRSCAVMSIVGHVLGLGDRHGENVLLIEDDGRVFHVDFNCLFDKGLTFEKPELVPFRLTHNMVDAMGAYGVEGPFRLAAELTLRQLRQHIDTLMTILETFLYDPTADFIGKKKRIVRNVPSTPEEVLESVKKKVRGFLPDETVPLSVEGYVDALIERARDPHKLAAMYIGWCAFF